MHKKLSSVLLIGCLFCLLFAGVFVGSAFGSLQTEAEYEFASLSNYDHIAADHPASDMYKSAVGQTFNTSYGGWLTNITVMLAYYPSSTDGYIGCDLVGVGNSVSGTPNGTVYDSSENGWHTQDYDLNVHYIVFQFNGTYHMEQNQYYGLVLTGTSGGVLDSAHYIMVGRDNTSPGDEGRYLYYANGGWYNTVGYDLVYEVKSSTVELSAGEAGGEEDAGTTGSSTDETISSLMWWFIYLIVMLAPAWFLGGFLKMGKWGFVIGLAIGAGVGYAFLAGFPLWLLILVVIGEVGLAYQSLSQGG